jgi:23S rRNA (pseudouridine1915-N3)-methyltransferase
MHKIQVLAVGKLKETHWQAAQREFVLRLAPFSKMEIIEVTAEPITGTADAARSMRCEGERLLGRLKPGDMMVALDRGGEEMASEKFAAFIEDAAGSGQRLVFIIGGAAGLDAAVLKRANKKISFSKMTFTHEMARVFLLEQIYRAETILTGKKYHH